jgi:glycosyltransferase involved in cell wall biosynthesis
MRIAQIATCSGPVREDQTGSVESLVWLLSRELTAMGHDVTVYGCAGSQSAGRTVVTLPGPYGDVGTPSDWQVCEWINLARALRDADRFDAIHSHVYLWALPLAQLSGTPIVHTMHTCPYEDEAILRALHPDACVTALSHHQWRGVGDIPPAAVIPHGVDAAQFTFRSTPDDYTCYLGRFIPGKGPLHAIAAAREAGIPIVLAGPPSDYFEAHVRPLVDGRSVRYVGPVDRRRRDALLGGARALLYPLTEPEPFGLVQIEAMLCGTPVVATDIGAVPEIVRDGLTGTIARTIADLPSALARAMTIDRARIRQEAVERFSARAMADAYLRVYQRLAAADRPQ